LTPYVEKGGKSLMFDRRFRHVGRVKRASGTLDLDELRQINEAFTAIAELDPPRTDIIRAVQDRIYTPREVWQAFRKQRLDSLISSRTSRALLFPAMRQWIETYQCSDKHRVSLHQSLRYFEAQGSKRSPIEDLPRLLEKFRVKMNASKQGRTFNITRSAAQAFVRSTMKRNHPIYMELAAVEVLPEIPTREGNPQTPDEMRALMKKLAPQHAKIAWGMAAGGMGPKEFWGKWTMLSDRVRIFGTKREGRNRFVPIIDAEIEHPTVEYRAFQKALLKATDGAVEPYDMRRSFSTWMEDAAIPRTRRRLYMGHGAVDVTDLYEKRDIQRFLAKDSKRLQKFVLGRVVSATKKPAIHLMKGSAS
jgi:integrase